MGRHERRTQVARFRREIAGSHLLTFLTDDLDRIDGEPVLKHALAHWLSVCEARKPICITCKRGFMDGAEPGAYLFAVSPSVANAASTSALCRGCWRDLPICEIEGAATRVLRRLVPRGRLE